MNSLLASVSPGGWAAACERGRYLFQALRTIAGAPDYGAYLRHMAATHPDLPPMDYEAFFRERLDARYGGKGRMARCC